MASSMVEAMVYDARDGPINLEHCKHPSNTMCERPEQSQKHTCIAVVGP